MSDFYQCEATVGSGPFTDTPESTMRYCLRVAPDDAILDDDMLRQILALHVPERPEPINRMCRECSRNRKTLVWWPCHVVRFAVRLGLMVGDDTAGFRVVSEAPIRAIEDGTP